MTTSLPEHSTSIVDRLRLLQTRIREVKGADRTLDAEILVALTPAKETSEDLIYLIIPRREDYCTPGTYWRKSRSGASLHTAPLLTTDPDGLGACVALCREVLPGYAWKVGTCCVSDDAWVVPDFNCPVHGPRLREKFGTIAWGSIWDTGIDIDRRPSGNVCLALLDAIVSAKISEEESSTLTTEKAG